VFAGSQVLYVAENGAHHGELRREGGWPIADLGPDRNKRAYKFTASTGFALSASPTRVAVLRFYGESVSTETTHEEVQLMVGPPGGPISVVAACSDPDPFGIRWDASIDGDRLAWLTSGCSPLVLPRQISVRDLATGDNIATVPVPAETGAVRLRGHYLAWADVDEKDGKYHQDVVVYDLATSSEVYRAKDVYPWASFDLQSDGKVVTYIRGPQTPPCPPLQLVWYAPTDPAPHQISACPLAGAPIVRGDRVLYFDFSPGVLRGELKVAPLDRSQPAKTVFSGPTALLRGDVDFDGSRVTYALGGCSAATGTIYVDDLSGPDATPEKPAPCRVKIRKRAEVSRRGVVTLRVRCPSDCSGTISLRRGRRRVSRTVALVSPRVKVGLRRSALRDLRRDGSLRLRTFALVDQRDRRTTRIRASIIVAFAHG
jgi:hypothetical protein